MLKPAFAIVLFVLVLCLLSQNRRSINWQLVFAGLGMQFLGAFFILKFPLFKEIFSTVAVFFTFVLTYSLQGSKFLFGNLATDGFGYILAIRILPSIIFFSALSAILFHWGILQRIIGFFSLILMRTLGLSGAESLAVTANIFIGQTEAPLLIKPYLSKMTPSEMLCLMSGGMATIAGGVYGAYIGFLGGEDESARLYFATHLLAASVISAPAAVVCSKILLPQTHNIEHETPLISSYKLSNVLEAITIGTIDGLKLAVNVGAMLLVFTALVYMVNGTMVALTQWLNHLCNLVVDCGNWNQAINDSTNGVFEGFNLSYLLGLIFAPIAWLLGVPDKDVLVMGQLLGHKVVVNEFYAYSQIPSLNLEPRTELIATYALCGFANFASVGIQIGGIGSLAPQQIHNLSKLGIRSLIAGSFACLMTAAVASLIL